jgi:hypothetical protein
MDRLIDDWIKERIDGTDPESMIYVAAERDPFEQYDIAMKWATFCEDEGRIDDKELGVLWMAADALKDLPTLLNESAQLSAYHSTGLTPEQVAALQADRDAWRKRAEAAEADMSVMADISQYAVCDLCKWYGEDGCTHPDPDAQDNCFEWNYPRDEGKEEKQDA